MTIYTGLNQAYIINKLINIYNNIYNGRHKTNFFSMLGNMNLNLILAN